MSKQFKITLTATIDLADTSLKSMAKLSTELDPVAAELAKALKIDVKSVEIDAKPTRSNGK